MHTRSRWLRTSSLGGLVFGNWTNAMAATAEDFGPWGMHMMWGSWGIGMMLMMLLFWAAVIAGIVVLIRWLVTSGHSERSTNAVHSTESALDILNKRYARGEISKQEFEDMRQDIRAKV